MIITLVGAKTYKIVGQRFIKDVPTEVDSYVASVAQKTGLFNCEDNSSNAILDLSGRPTVVYPRTVAYDIMKQRPHHLLKALANKGFYVVFVDAAEKHAVTEVSPGMFVVGSNTSVIFGKPSILYWTYPKHVVLAKSYDYTIFDSIDLPEGAFHHWEQGYEESLVSANMVLASADLLFEKAIAKNRNVHLIPNAVDYEMFKAAQERMYPKPEGLDGRPVVGFYGALGVWIDTDLIVETCKRMPDYQFLIIGPTYYNPIKEVPPNMIKLELLPYEELPRYLSWFDVGIIPFKTGGVSEACNPLKMWEYMSAGKPFVVTNLPEAKMGISATTEDFAFKIDWAMSTAELLKPSLIEAASENTWEARIKKIPLPFKLPELATSKDPTKVVTVFMAVSPNWFQHVAKQIYSMDKYCSTKLNVFILTDMEYNFPQYPDTLTTTFNVLKYYQELLPHGFNVEARYSKYTLYRLMIPKLLPGVDKAIYLDADTLVTCDLWELFNREVKMIAGIEDTGAVTHRRDLGLEKYINAGVLLMNLKAIREVGDKWLAMCNTKEYRFNDQDIINMTCDIEYLPAYYNKSVCTPKSCEPGIIHYAGKKPWADDVLSPAWESVEYTEKIPRIIHYCWFGGGKKPDLVLKCIESWKKYCPDYTIKEWNEASIHVDYHPYLRAAYDSGKYAFVSDFIRVCALKHYGGVYMDSDYELFKPIDKFLQHRAFTGYEIPSIPITAIMGSEANHPWVLKILNYYDKAKFEIKPNTAFIPGLMAEDFISEGLYKNDLHVYPIETFCNYNHVERKVIPSENAVGVHHFSGSWLKRENT